MGGEPRGYDDLDVHLDTLKRQGLLYSIDRAIDKDTEMHPLVRWQYRGGIAEADRKAFLFTNITDARGRHYPGARVAIGALAGNRQIYALGMKKPEADIGKAWLEAIAHPIAPRQVATTSCQEVVETGDILSKPGHGLDALPIPISTPGYDTAPYLTAALWFTRDPDNGIQNMGLYRGNLKAPDRLAVMMERSTLAGGGVHWLKYKKRGQPMPVAVALGAPPIVAFVGPQKMPLDCDELTVAGGLAGCPINVVKAKTVDLLVPAESQVVIEGFIDTERLEPEGPFGESHGYMALEEYNFSMRVTAITRRSSYTITSIISQVTPSESSVIKKVAYEPLYLSHLRDALNIKGVVRVSMHEPLTNLRPFVFLIMKKGMPKTEIWRALMGTASLTPAIGKFCIALDEDIDPEDTDHVLWAIAYRSNPQTDTHVVPNRGKGHGPALKGSDIDATMLIDATAKGDYPPVALPKKEYMERARAIWGELKLPPLRPQSPWSGYSLGDWSETWDACAARAAQGDWIANGRRSAAHMSSTAQPQDPARGIPDEDK
ncbi:4-hydroxy-3-polyprenylbenzoate decarboxylase [Enhydrobacter aerosaccus]|uniref:4-hydroxy-3-polyprenylbenzoate decarboxylase n=1 Tax=Enhydrobacter aerosaccus TaxID=225324 RepID=A0A1T4SUT3_9HYPH|nr:UbiD family decarboxylase [Enhydrobacter aerosaccus]SKA31661.1 4-hydroxy-3-polyprenylbenzoate decarboxylase [Enhydrobacter aerosaccus]